MKGTITIRIYLSSLNKVKRSFPAERGETMAHYFERLQQCLTKWDILL